MPRGMHFQLVLDLMDKKKLGKCLFHKLFRCNKTYFRLWFFIFEIILYYIFNQDGTFRVACYNTIPIF